MTKDDLLKRCDEVLNTDGISELKQKLFSDYKLALEDLPENCYDALNQAMDEQLAN